MGLIENILWSQLAFQILLLFTKNTIAIAFDYLEVLLLKSLTV